MKFTLSAAVFAISTLAVAMPHEAGLDGDMKWPVPHGMTVKEAQSKCGDQAQLSCCNQATYAGDTKDMNSGALSGLLSNLIGAGSGAQGAGIFSQCSQLTAQVAVVGIPLQDILDQRCKQNIACCANSGGSANGNGAIGASLPCVALGSIL